MPRYARVDAIAGAVVIVLTGIGALAVLKAIRRRLGGHAQDEATDFDDLGGVDVRAIAAELDAEHDW